MQKKAQTKNNGLEMMSLITHTRVPLKYWTTILEKSTFKEFFLLVFDVGQAQVNAEK